MTDEVVVLSQPPGMPASGSRIMLCALTESSPVMFCEGAGAVEPMVGAVVLLQSDEVWVLTMLSWPGTPPRAVRSQWKASCCVLQLSAPMKICGCVVPGVEVVGLGAGEGTEALLRPGGQRSTRARRRRRGLSACRRVS